MFLHKRGIALVVLVLLGAVLLIGATAAWALLAGQPQGQVVYQPANILSTREGGPYPEIPRVTLEGARAAFDEKTAVFVDTRANSSYQEGHIPGAISAPNDQLLEKLSALSHDKWIITYCT